MAQAALDERIAAVRRFNRFYTQQIGVLREGLLDSRFSLTEARVLYELAHRTAPTAGELAHELRLDPGYLSRLLRGFRRQGLIERAPGATDRRRRDLTLTAAGRAAFAPLDAGARTEIAALLAAMPEAAQAALVGAMRTIERLFAPASAAGADAGCTLRPHRPGDLGWIVSRHGALYATEYGFDLRFEALVAQIAAAFVTAFDAARERCWVAERDGEPVGSVCLVRGDDSEAKLRLLLVEPTARGLGIGGRLVAECIAFARAAGYARLTLWTQSILVAARRRYRDAGFRLVRSEPHHSFGHDLVGEYWELPLQDELNVAKSII